LEVASRELGASKEVEKDLRGKVERQGEEISGLKEMLVRASSAAESVSGDLGPKLELALAEAEQARANEKKAAAKVALPVCVSGNAPRCSTDSPRHCVA
jgi:hypothetical protein